MPRAPVAARTGPAVKEHFHRSGIGFYGVGVIFSVAPVKIFDEIPLHLRKQIQKK
jgi:hypothetical protein